MTGEEDGGTNSKAQNSGEKEAEKADSSKSTLVGARYQVRRHKF